MTASSNLLILTLAYPPATGGAAVYTKLLSEGLIQQGFSGNIVVLAESYPGYPKKQVLENGKLQIWRIFPFHSELSRKSWKKYLKYAIQNVQFLWIPILAKQLKITHLIIHCHYYYNLSLIPLIIYGIKMISKLKLIIDVRDPKMPIKKFHYFNQYNSIICCSESVLNHLSQEKFLIPKSFLIPIPLEVKKISQKFVEECQIKFGLNQKRYFLSTNGFLKEKGIDLLLEVAEKLKIFNPNVILVIAGKKKDWNYQYQEVIKKGLVRYIDVIPNDEVLALAQGAELVVNFSEIEGMPRSSLEAIAIGAKVLLPLRIPEFQRECPGNIMQSYDSDELIKQILEILKQDSYLCNYDLSKHFLSQVIPQYLKLLN